MTSPDVGHEPDPHRGLLHRGFALEYAMLGWNAAGIAVLKAASR